MDVIDNDRLYWLDYVLDDWRNTRDEKKQTNNLALLSDVYDGLFMTLYTMILLTYLLTFSAEPSDNEVKYKNQQKVPVEFSFAFFFWIPE